MFNCFTVKKKNKKQDQEQPNTSAAESLLNSQIDAAIHSSVWWSMDHLSSKAVNDSGQPVAPANAVDGSASPDQANGHDSPQQSSLPRLDKLAVNSTTWDEQSIKAHDYVNVPATPGDSYSSPVKSRGTHPRQPSSVTQPDQLPVVSSKTLANQTIENLDYVVMQGKPKGTTPGDRCPLPPTPNDTHSPQRSSKMRLLDEVVADIEKWAKEIDQCSASLQKTYSGSKYRLPTLLSVDKTPPSQQSNTVTEINSELLRALQKRREKIDVNDSAQKIDSPLSQQMAAMEPHCSFSAGPFNIKPYHGSRTPLAVTVADNRNQ